MVRDIPFLKALEAKSASKSSAESWSTLRDVKAVVMRHRSGPTPVGALGSRTSSSAMRTIFSRYAGPRTISTASMTSASRMVSTFGFVAPRRNEYLRLRCRIQTRSSEYQPT